MEQSLNHRDCPPPKPWRRVSAKLTAWLALGFLILTSLAGYLGAGAMESRAVERTRQTGTWFSDTVKRATRYSMLRDQRDNVHEIIKAIGEQEGVEAIRVFNKQGRIMFSSRKSEIGEMVDLQAEACYACHFKDRPLERLPQSSRSRIFTAPLHDEGSHRVLGVINPIYTEPACYTDPCHVHPPGQKVLGVLDVGLSLAGVDREVSGIYRQVAGVSLVIFLVMAGVLGVVSFLMVSRPLTGLVGATRRIASGDYDHPVTCRSPDEIGALAQDFDLMRQSVKEKTEALTESRRQFQTLFEQVPCYISVQDKDFRLVALNRMFARDFGEKLGEYCFRAYKGREARCLNCAVEKTFQDGRVHTAEETVVGQDGRPRYFLNITAPITDARGDIVSVMEMATDVTEIRTLECELQKSEENYRLFFNNDPNAIFVFDRGTLEILDANDRAVADYGRSKESLVGRPFQELTDQADQARLEDFLARGGSLLPRLHQIRGDGSVFVVNLRASFGEYLGRPAVIAASADISETLKTEQQLVQAAKMATLGEMSAGVAHELNQPLSVLYSAGSLLLKQIKKGAAPNPKIIREVALEITAQVERSKRIINHLREFGRKSDVERSKVDLTRPIRGVFQLLGQQMHVHDVDVILDLPKELPPIWGDENRLEQVFINLVLNARDAIEDRRQKEKGFPGEILVRARANSDEVVVHVTDNGCGIPQEMNGRIFEPFFTTKEVGRGTGLGLSISYGIVRDYGGKIDLDSSPGQGTTFRLSFPLAVEVGS